MAQGSATDLLPVPRHGQDLSRRSRSGWPYERKYRGHAARCRRASRPHSRPWCGSNRAPLGDRKPPLTPFESYGYRKKLITHLFSATYWDNFFRPFAFNKLLGGSFIFNIFFIFALYFQQLIGRFPFPLFSITYWKQSPSLESLCVE